MSDGIVGAIAISLFGSEKKRRDSMDAGYTILGNDVDVCRMFDQFSYKRNENLDFSLNVPQHHHQASYHQDGYAMADQTFHAPSFGEDFDIPALHSHSHQHQQHQQQQQQHQQQQQQQQQQHHQQQQAQHDSMHGYQAQMMQTGGIQQSPDGLNLDPGGYQQSLYMQQDHSMQPMSVSSTYSNSQGSYATMSSPRQQHGNQQMMLLQQQQQQQQQQQAQIQQHMQYMHTQQQQQQLQQQIQYRSPAGGSPSSIQPSIVPEPNNNTTTSEDSDDSTPHSGMITGIKRPSPEPIDAAVKSQRKPKSQKKKKKRDPNEPQKPVSAYALFFRDTQAAIKGQNPNASFGEVSKIVASMWDALDTEHKNVYKKKTEAAKKEYLQALAAYRASLVSKGAAENEQQQQQPSPQQQQQQQVQYAAYGNYAGSGTAGNVSYQVYSPQPQPSSPQQQHPHSHSHSHSHQHQHQQQPQQMQIKKSVHLAMSGNPQQQTQQALIANQMAPTHIAQQHQQSQPQPQQQQHMQQQYMQIPQQQVQVQQQSQQHHQQQQMMHTSPPKGDSLSSPPPVNSSAQATMAGQSPASNACIRHGCPNLAVANSEWEDEYCSNECVVSHCRDVFTTWVSSNQNSQQNFSTVK